MRSLIGLALLIFPAVASGQTNLAPNPSFETVSGSVAQNWTLCINSGAATLTTATTPIDQGARSLKVTLTQAGDAGVCSDAITVPSGVTFRLAARSDVNISTIQNKQVRLQGGIAYGHPFKVNSTHDGVGRLVALEAQSDGSFRLVWEGLGANGEGEGLRARLYDGDGNSTGVESVINSLINSTLSDWLQVLHSDTCEA